MWFSKWFKPVETIKTEQINVEPPAQINTDTLQDRLRELCHRVDVDKACSDVVMRRYLITVHWQDIQGLFEAVLNCKKNTPTLIAVNLYSYFKTAGSPASVCLSRLCDSLDKADSVPHSVRMDVTALIQLLKQLANTYPKEQ